MLTCYLMRMYLLKLSSTEDGKKMCVCPSCNKGFSTSFNLEQYMKIHLHEKPFTFDTCQKSFRRKSELARHLKIHNFDEQPTFKCVKC